MTPVLLLPAALAALAALVLPLVIHIARRSEQQPTDFAALRWLSEHARPRSRLRLDEWPLLLVRLLLVALVALLLARPALSGLTGDRTTVVVIPGADIGRAGLDPAAQHRAVWLAPGFPRVRDGGAPAGQPVGSLLRELDAGLPRGTALTVVAPAVLQGADGERPRLARPVRWLVTPGTMAAPVRPASAPLDAALRYDAAHAGDLRYLRAALMALRPDGPGSIGPEPDAAGLEAPLPPSDKPLVRLAGGTLPPDVAAFASAGGTVLVSSDALMPSAAGPAVTLWADGSGTPLVEARGLGTGQLLRFTRPLRPAAMPALLEADFPARLQTVLGPTVAPPSRAYAASYAPTATGTPAEAPQPTDLRPWLAVLIAALAVLERGLATRRVRGVSP